MGQLEFGIHHDRRTYFGAEVTMADDQSGFQLVMTLDEAVVVGEGLLDRARVARSMFGKGGE